MYSHDGPFFTGTLMKLSASRNRAKSFNVLQVQIDGENATTIRGDGLLSHYGNVAISGGMLLGPIESHGALLSTEAQLTLSAASSDLLDHVQAYTDDELVLVCCIDDLL